jgi:hypothetical protein
MMISDRVFVLDTPSILGYKGNYYHIVPVPDYTAKNRKRHVGNVRIFRYGGGIRFASKMPPKSPFLIRMTGPDGASTNYDNRIQTTCIELEACE